MRATQQLQYAIYGVFDLAYNAGSGPVRVQEISERQGIPIRYLEQIFQKLRRAGLVESKRGPGGGYMLARPSDRISLADVLRAVQGDVLTGIEARRESLGENPGFIWEVIAQGIDRTLAHWTLSELCREAARRGVDRAESEPAMYHI